MPGMVLLCSAAYVLPSGPADGKTQGPPQIGAGALPGRDCCALRLRSVLSTQNRIKKRRGQFGRAVFIWIGTASGRLVCERSHGSGAFFCAFGSGEKISPESARIKAATEQGGGFYENRVGLFSV